HHRPAPGGGWRLDLYQPAAAFVGINGTTGSSSSTWLTAQHGKKARGGGGPDHRAQNGHKRVPPVAVPFPADRQQRMCDARPKITCRVDRITGGPAQRKSDTEYQ